MESDKKIRLGHVEGEDAARLRETLNVEGMSLEEFTRRAVKLYLDQKDAQDKARHEADTLSVNLAGETIPYRYVDGLGMCLICPEGPVTLERFAELVGEALKEAMKSP